MAEALEYGMVDVNSGPISNEVGPFGGIKQSGVGHEGSCHGIGEHSNSSFCAWKGLSALPEWGPGKRIR